MDALVLSAQVWVPWLGVACLAAGQAWIAWLGAGLHGDRAASYPLIAGFFLALATAIVAPAAAAVAAWALGGGLALWGPLLILDAPASSADQILIALSLTAPLAAFLIARFLFNSADGVAWGVAAAAALTAQSTFDAPLVFAVTLAAGGLAAVGVKALGDVAAAIGAAVAFVFAFAFAYAGGGDVVALLTITVLGGFVLALVAAGGKRSRIPLFVILPLVPALAMALLDGSAPTFDLTAALPAPASGTLSSLILLCAVLPALAAPFIWLPGAIVHLTARRNRLAGLAIEPVSLVVGVVAGMLAGLTALVVVAIALAGGAALYSKLHELGGGSALLRAQSMISQIRAAPADAWWAIALVLLPLAPPLVHLVRAFVTAVSFWLTFLGVTRWVDRLVAGSQVADRFVLTFVKRGFQAAVGVVFILMLNDVATLAIGFQRSRAPEFWEWLFDACAAIARAVDAWRVI